MLLIPLRPYSPVLIHHLRRWHIARQQNMMARARGKKRRDQDRRKVSLRPRPVQGGIVTLHLGTEAKQARVGRACHRLLARILLYQTVETIAGRKASRLSAGAS